MNRNDLTEAVRQTLRRFPEPHAAHYGVVPAAPSEDAIPLRGVAVAIGEAHAALKEAAVAVGDLHDSYRLTRIQARKEAISSSAIEGVDATLEDLLLTEEGACSKSVSTRLVRDYALALETTAQIARDTGPEIFGIGLIRDLHEATMKSDADYRDKKGEFRQRTVWIGGADIARSTYNPPPHQFVSGCMEDHIRYLRADDIQLVNQDFVTRLAVAHAHFEGVHPFCDGNGRVGRLLLPVMMAAEGHEPVYLSSFIEQNKRRYYDGLMAAQKRLDHSPLVVFLADAIKESVQELKRLYDDFADLRAEWLVRGTWRAGSTAGRALNILPEHPVLSVGRLAELLGVPYQSASNAITDLVERHILRETSRHAQNRIFIAPEAMAVLERPFGSYEISRP